MNKIFEENPLSKMAFVVIVITLVYSAIIRSADVVEILAYLVGFTFLVMILRDKGLAKMLQTLAENYKKMEK